VKKVLDINIEAKTPFEKRESISAKEYFAIIWRELQ
jgi:hypothetical protein